MPAFSSFISWLQTGATLQPEASTMRALILVLLSACVPKAVPPSGNVNAAVEIHLPAREEPVQVNCILRFVRPPFVTVHMSVFNGSKDAIVIGRPPTRMHVAHAPTPIDELRVFVGPSPWPSRDEVHLLLRDPSGFKTLEPNSTQEYHGGFEMRPAPNGVRFDPGGSAEGVLPLGCSVSYWKESDWNPDEIRVSNLAESTTVHFLGVFR